MAMPRGPLQLWHWRPRGEHPALSGDIHNRDGPRLGLTWHTGGGSGMHIL